LKNCENQSNLLQSEAKKIRAATQKGWKIQALKQAINARP
jgi:hypothetical protein